LGALPRVLRFQLERFGQVCAPGFQLVKKSRVFRFRFGQGAAQPFNISSYRLAVTSDRLVVTSGRCGEFHRGPEVRPTRQEVSLGVFASGIESAVTWDIREDVSALLVRDREDECIRKLN